MFTKTGFARQAQRGMTLIELIMFIVIVSVGVAGILGVMNVTVKSSSDPVVRKQSLALAESILDEVLAKDFANPASGGYTETAPTTCANRAFYDDVDDYSCFDGSTDSKKIHGDVTLGATSLADLSAYRASIAVDATASAVIGGITTGDIKKVTVTVTGSGETLQLSGYRAKYP
jgi:MSHA pilin protein MshD